MCTSNDEYDYIHYIHIHILCMCSVLYNVVCTRLYTFVHVFVQGCSMKKAVYLALFAEGSSSFLTEC